jgi:hypothetical protein
MKPEMKVNENKRKILKVDDDDDNSDMNEE